MLWFGLTQSKSPVHAGHARWITEVAYKLKAVTSKSLNAGRRIIRCCCRMGIGDCKFCMTNWTLPNRDTGSKHFHRPGSSWIEQHKPEALEPEHGNPSRNGQGEIIGGLTSRLSKG
jgi:hypothetical protein